MLEVYGQHKYFNSYSAGIDFSWQHLATKIDPRAVKVNIEHYQKISSEQIITCACVDILYHFILWSF